MTKGMEKKEMETLRLRNEKLENSNNDFYPYANENELLERKDGDRLAYCELVKTIKDSCEEDISLIKENAKIKRENEKLEEQINNIFLDNCRIAKRMEDVENYKATEMDVDNESVVPSNVGVADIREKITAYRLQELENLVLLCQEEVRKKTELLDMAMGIIDKEV